MGKKNVPEMTRIEKKVSQELKTPLQDLVIEIVTGGNRFSPEDFKEYLDEIFSGAPSGYRLAFRKLFRDQIAKHVEAGACSWEFVEEQLKIFMGDKHYEAL